MSEDPQLPPEHGGQQHGAVEFSPLDQAFLHASRLRMAGEEAESVGAGMTEDVIGHAGLADMVQQVTQQLGATAHAIAGRMEQDLHAVAEQQQREEGTSGHG